MNTVDSWHCGRVGHLGVALELALGLTGCAGGPPLPAPPAVEPPPVEVPDEDHDRRESFWTEWELPADYEPSFARTHFDPPAPLVDEASLDDGIVDSPWAAELEERVDYWVGYWQTQGAERFSRYLIRMGRYVDMVDREVATRYLPPSLRYLPIVESGYATAVSSRARALGLWQLMTPTARSMGLEVNGLLDQRRDPFVATPVALDYLTYLHDRFGSWFLALAAYNAGPSRLSRTLERHARGAELTDELYVTLRSRLPRETRDFVPRFLAAARIAANPAAYGFGQAIPDEAVSFEEVVAPGGIELKKVAEAAGLAPELVVELNPHFVRRLTPPARESMVRVPPGYAGEELETKLASIPPEQRLAVFDHRVAKGETLGHIAERYGIRLSDLQAANPGVNPRRLQIGQRLSIIMAGAGGEGRARPGKTNASPSSAPRAEHGPDATPDPPGPGIHVIRSGDSLWTIARAYGVRVDDLRRWNGLRAGQLIYPGNRLRVAPDPPG